MRPVLAESRKNLATHEGFARLSTFLTIEWGEILQRLYSTFADGWPGAALLLQRVVVAVIIVRSSCIVLTDPHIYPVLPHIVAACAAMLFLVGLWTPFAGTLIAVVELWAAMTSGSDLWLSILLATTGAASAMLGPGAFSLDARLFGRRHLDL